MAEPEITAPQLNREQVRKVAELAHLALSDQEEEQLARELSQILGYVAQLQQLDTRDVAPTSAASLAMALREDRVQPSLPAEVAIGNAPATVLTSIAVPRIID